MYAIGIDVGGTNLKAGLVNEAGQILSVSRTPLHFTTAENFAEVLADLSRQVMGDLPPEAIDHVGIGIPGAVQGGNILFTANIPMRDVPLKTLFQKHLKLPVTLANDADCAAAGEYLFGAGKGTRDFIIVTLGTGVGGGMILGGRLHTGKCCAGEVGHMVIDLDGEPCSCGRAGCWESYASATGLIRMGRQAAAAHPDSLLSQLARQKAGLDGKSIFTAAEQEDLAAREVVTRFVNYLAAGVTNLVNILQPDVVAIGGGVAGAPEHLLLTPLRNYVHEYCYGRHVGHYPKVVNAQMGNDAGIVGAALIHTLL